MTLLLSLLAGAAAAALAWALFEWRWGPAPGRHELQRALQRLSAGAAPPAALPPLRRFLAPPEIPRLRPFWLQWALVALAAGLTGWLLTAAPAWGLVFAAIAVPLWRQVAVRQAVLRRRQLLGDQFKDALAAIAASLRAGNSLVSACERAVPDLQRLLRGQPETPVIEEFTRLSQELRLGSSLEEALLRLRDRAQLEDVTDFVGATLLCRVRGGNLPEVVSAIAQIIAEKAAVRHQVRVLTAGKRLESFLLTLTPPALVGAMALSSPGYLAPLLATLPGQLLVLLACLLLAGAVLIGRRIVDIEV